LTRRKFFRRIAACAPVPAYAFGVEPKWLDRTITRIPVAAIAPGARVRILQLSDLHVSSFVPLSLIERAVDMGLAMNPDLVCLTGDFITNRQAFDGPEYRRILKKLSLQAPTFGSLGNHDGGPWAARHIGGYEDTGVVRALLADSGVRLLHNESVDVRGVRMAGVGDLWNEQVDAARAFAAEPTRLPTVLMAHNPDTKDLAGAFPWHVMLCGHTHGGQVLVPGIGARFVAVRDKTFVSGLKQWNGKHIYISRGVGNLAGVRLNCRPEVSVLDLVSPTALLDAEHRV